MPVITNPYRYAAAAPSSAFGLASRDFDGSNDYIETIGYKGVTGTSARTVAGWFRTSSTATGFNRNLIFTYGVLNVNGAYFQIGVENGSFIGRFFGNTFNAGSGYNDGNWHAFSVAMPASTNTAGITVYLDGSAVSPTTTGTDTLDTGNSFNVRIGHFATFDNNGFFDGNLADIRLYSRAITSSEAADLAAGTDIDNTDLEGWWLLNDDDVLDYSGNSRDGTNNGSTYSTDGPLD